MADVIDLTTDDDDVLIIEDNNNNNNNRKRGKETLLNPFLLTLRTNTSLFFDSLFLSLSSPGS